MGEWKIGDERERDRGGVGGRISMSMNVIVEFRNIKLSFMFSRSFKNRNGMIRVKYGSC